ncbi:hypothetical protein PISL3812_08348 [Talaromyces islandicus]|uniref:Uncharacterized protein n=1 Tax=Talaromyces islandicus TaxID=28573 RepID=A0A0U1M8M4_TALIS|nr:hypothetical protein PISL3812_08348 [Talaromyces islandicus]
MDSNSCQSIIIGLDFGTTYSGIAWALKDSENLVEVVSTWPDGGNRTSPKVPTTISYDNQKFSWGFQTTHSEDVIRGIKLLLDPDQETNYNPFLNAKKLLKSLDKTPSDVTADYLKELVDHAKDILKRRFGPAANHMDRVFVLTIPAVWSDKAKDVTLKAAHSAGIPPSKLTMLSEPESAALYALRSITEYYQGKTLNSNDDVIVVCDAGGGTVDLISYAVESLSPLSLKEIVEGTGGLCGSMILDERFENFLEDLIGPKRFKKLSKRTKDSAHRYWQEVVKPNFVGKSDDDFDACERAVPLPGAKNDTSIGLEAGFLLMNESQIQGIFYPVVQDVLALVRGQIKNIQATYLSVKAIVLVGGFGGSEYLYRRLRPENPKLTVMQPPNAWQAIVQ